ncbi:hypothetical protein VKT23_020765, partial [Stygiomarasmius scandens]
MVLHPFATREQPEPVPLLCFEKFAELEAFFGTVISFLQTYLRRPGETWDGVALRTGLRCRSGPVSWESKLDRLINGAQLSFLTTLDKRRPGGPLAMTKPITIRPKEVLVQEYLLMSTWRLFAAGRVRMLVGIGPLTQAHFRLVERRVLPPNHLFNPFDFESLFLYAWEGRGLPLRLTPLVLPALSPPHASSSDSCEEDIPPPVPPKNRFSRRIAYKIVLDSDIEDLGRSETSAGVGAPNIVPSSASGSTGGALSVGTGSRGAEQNQSVLDAEVRATHEAEEVWAAPPVFDSRNEYGEEAVGLDSGEEALVAHILPYLDFALELMSEEEKRDFLRPKVRRTKPGSQNIPRLGDSYGRCMAWSKGRNTHVFCPPSWYDFLRRLPRCHWCNTTASPSDCRAFDVGGVGGNRSRCISCLGRRERGICTHALLFQFFRGAHLHNPDLEVGLRLRIREEFTEFDDPFYSIRHAPPLYGHPSRSLSSSSVTSSSSLMPGPSQLSTPAIPGSVSFTRRSRTPLFLPGSRSPTPFGLHLPVLPPLSNLSVPGSSSFTCWSRTPLFLPDSRSPTPSGPRFRTPIGLTSNIPSVLVDTGSSMAVDAMDPRGGVSRLDRMDDRTDSELEEGEIREFPGT